MRPSKISSARHDAGAARGVGKIGGDGLDPGPVTATPLQCLAQTAREVIVVIDRARDDHHVGALGREALGQGRADTATGAGDDRVLSLESLHEVSLPSR